MDNTKLWLVPLFGVWRIGLNAARAGWRRGSCWQRQASRFFYDVRSAPLLWLVLGVLSLTAGGTIFWALQRGREIWWPEQEWFNTPGPWTLILVATGAPIAWFIWFVRDWNKAQEIHVSRSQVINRSAEHAWETFRQLQEWATKEHDALQAAAIHQLRPFILGLAGGVIPAEIVSGGNPFHQASIEILRALLDDRSWERHWTESLQGTKSEAEAFQKRDKPTQQIAGVAVSPVARAIEAVLRDPLFRPSNLANWNLSRLDLSGVEWVDVDLERAKLIHTNLQGANLQEAHLFNANLEYANLISADLTHALLTGANLSHAILAGVNLTGASLIRTKWENTNLASANLSRASLLEVNLDSGRFYETNIADAEISKKWEGLLRGTKGQPKWIPDLNIAPTSI